METYDIEQLSQYAEQGDLNSISRMFDHYSYLSKERNQLQLVSNWKWLTFTIHNPLPKIFLYFSIFTEKFFI